MRHAALALCVLALGACHQPSAAAAPPRPNVANEPHAAPSVAAVPAHGSHHGTANAAAPARPGANGSRAFGEPVSTAVPVVRLGQILAAPSQHSGHPLRVEGRVVAVCQSMGCWMEIQDENTQAHVRMHGHSFFVPRDISGHRAVVQGTLVAAHPPTECDEEAREATGRVAQVEIDATGVEVYD